MDGSCFPTVGTQHKGVEAPLPREKWQRSTQLSVIIYWHSVIGVERMGKAMDAETQISTPNEVNANPGATSFLGTVMFNMPLCSTITKYLRIWAQEVTAQSL